MANEKEIDKLVLDRLNQMMEISDGARVEHHLETNAGLTEKSIEFLTNLVSQHGTENLGKVNINEITKNNVDPEDDFQKKLLEEINKIKANYVDVPLSYVLSNISFPGNEIKIDLEKIQKEQERIEKERQEEIRQAMAGIGAFIGGLVGVGAVAQNFSLVDDPSKNNVGFAGLFNPLAMFSSKNKALG